MLHALQVFKTPFHSAIFFYIKFKSLNVRFKKNHTTCGTIYCKASEDLDKSAKGWFTVFVLSFLKSDYVHWTTTQVYMKFHT